MVLLAIVVVLSLVSLQGTWKFRGLTKSFRARATELSKAARLSQSVSDLRSTIWKATATENKGDFQFPIGKDKIDGTLHLTCTQKLTDVKNALEDYKLELKTADSPRLFGDNSRELEFVQSLTVDLHQIESILTHREWVLDNYQARNMDDLQTFVDNLQDQANKIPSMFRQRMDAYAASVRNQYYTWMVLTVACSIIAAFMLVWLFKRFSKRVFQPLESLAESSRIVAGGNYDHRIKMDSNDEMAELAGALNAMTQNFQDIKSDLNKQVRKRTKEVVRSEKMASVGFLAAGVAHEINNPLASIAWSAESLESRLHEILNPVQEMKKEERDAQIADMKKYLQRIQDEAFRCKGITSALLDFSRMGDSRKQMASLTETIQSVIDMVKPLSRYRGRTVKFRGNPSVSASVNQQEIKQVILNLITNSLDSVSEDGVVEIRLERKGNNALLIVSDNGCGMTDDVMQHLFEPFFTRRRDGQGTGLGLSITYQIVQEHGGTIVPYSEGPGKGSTFTISLPLVNNSQSGNQNAIKPIAA